MFIMVPPMCITDERLKVTLEGDLDKAKAIDLSAPIVIGKHCYIIFKTKLHLTYIFVNYVLNTCYFISVFL